MSYIYKGKDAFSWLPPALKFNAGVENGGRRPGPFSHVIRAAGVITRYMQVGLTYSSMAYNHRPYGTELEAYHVSTTICVQLRGRTPRCAGTKFCRCCVQYSRARRTRETREQRKGVGIRDKDCFCEGKDPGNGVC